jgi:hypothetical protein
MLFRPLRAFGLSEQTPLLLDYRQMRLEFARRAQDAGVRYFVVRSIDDVQNLEFK